MKKMIFVAALFAAAQASAVTLSCVFTEPFINVSFDSETNAITSVGPENWNEQTETFDIQSLGLGSLVAISETENKFELQGEDGKAIMTLVLDMNGSDGMSDNTYPFTADYNGLYGGCYTENAQPWNVYSIIEDLGVTFPTNN